MIVWMVARESLYEELRAKGRLVMRTLDDVAVYDEGMREDIRFYQDGATSDAQPCPVIEPYHWLATQMQERLTGQRGEWAYPWQAYWQFNTHTQKPDMRTVRHWWSPDERKETHVLLRLDVPNNKILLYDDEAWVAGPLNQGAVTLSQSEFETFYGDDTHTKREEDMDCQGIAETWSRIFDIDMLKRSADPAWGAYGRTIIAAFIDLELDYVRSIKYYPKKNPFLGVGAMVEAGAKRR